MCSTLGLQQARQSQPTNNSGNGYEIWAKLKLELCDKHGRGLKWRATANLETWATKDNLFSDSHKLQNVGSS